MEIDRIVDDLRLDGERPHDRHIALRHFRAGSLISGTKVTQSPHHGGTGLGGTDSGSDADAAFSDEPFSAVTGGGLPLPSSGLEACSPCEGSAI